MTLDASGATEPGMSLKRQDDRALGDLPAPLVADVFHRAWPGLPCCIAPFSVRGYSNYTLGDATQDDLRDDLEQPGLSRLPHVTAIRHPAGALSELRHAMEPVSLVIPTLNEADAIGAVIREIPPAFAGDIIIADSGSTDGTQDIARAAGARVIDAGRGYGRACALGAQAANPASQVIIFMDGDGADRGDLIGRIAGPVLDGTHDFVLASRTRGEREAGSMLWHQVLAGRVAGWGMGALYGVRYSDMCAFRAIGRQALEAIAAARDDLWLEHRDATARGPGGAAHPRGAAALPVPRRWRVEGRRVVPGDNAGGQPYPCDILARRGLEAGGARPDGPGTRPDPRVSIGDDGKAA